MASLVYHVTRCVVDHSVDDYDYDYYDESASIVGFYGFSNPILFLA